MKKLIHIIFIAISLSSYSQISVDKQRLDTIRPHKMSFYLSLGLGMGAAYHQAKPITTLKDFSISYKTHTITICHGWASNFGGGDEGKDGFHERYNGILIGETMHSNNFLIGGYFGVANSIVSYYFHPNPQPSYTTTENYYLKGTTYPLDIRIFYVFTDHFGIGIHGFKNFAPKTKYSPLSITASVVFGNWKYNQ